MTSDLEEDLLQIEEFLEEVSSSNNTLFLNFCLEIIKFLDQKFMRKINYGIYDSYITLLTLEESKNISLFYEKFLLEYRKNYTLKIPIKEFKHYILDITIKRLVNEGVLLYVYDKQRIRTRIAEMIFYFINLKQRLIHSKLTYQDEASLVQMVKFFPIPRLSPIRNMPFQKAKDILIRRIGTLEKEPIFEKKYNYSDFQNNLENIEEMLNIEGKQNLAKFQINAFIKLFIEAVQLKKSAQNTVNILSAGTGAGKTEGFLLPIILYCLSLRGKSRSTGTKALLLYPRIDLCNNQLERLVRYLYLIEKIEDKSTELKPIKVAIQHSKTSKIKFKCPYENCSGNVTAKENSPGPPYEVLVCDENCENHTFENITLGKWAPADIIITTPDSLHRRLMDTEGNKHIWNKKSLPRFIILDEAHIYTGQSGIHVMNVIKRLKKVLKEKTQDDIEPVFIASSATIGNKADAKKFAKKLFTANFAEIFTPEPAKNELEEIGREYIILVKATTPKKTQLPKYISKKNYHKDIDELTEEKVSTTFASNLSCMIQVAFCYHHTMKKTPQKNKVLGFVDSIDLVKRLGDKVFDADNRRKLFTMRSPITKTLINEIEINPANLCCPYFTNIAENFKDNISSSIEIPCRHIPPNPHVTPCPVYNDGECWWIMDKSIDQKEINVQIHKSGLTQSLSKNDEEWDLMITTSALEVGFDNDGIIGTFQYMAPNNIPGFVQRKGRGGRKPTDMPISVVVLGSRPKDDFFFQHPSLLVYPDPSRLRIPLDTDNTYINTKHVITSIFDAINQLLSYDEVNSVYKKVDMEIVRNICYDNNPDIKSGELIEWIQESFNIRYEVAQETFTIFRAYVESCCAYLDEDTKFYDLIHYDSRSHVRTQIISDCNKILKNLEEK